MMSLDIFKVIGELEDIMDKSSHVPLTKKVLIDEDILQNCLDRIRNSLPHELKEAQRILNDKERVILEARNEAGNMLEDARREIDRQIDETEIVKQARILADSITKRSESISNEMRQGALEYADDILNNLEKNLSSILTEIRNGRNELISEEENKEEEE